MNGVFNAFSVRFWHQAVPDVGFFFALPEDASTFRIVQSFDNADLFVEFEQGIHIQRA